VLASNGINKDRHLRFIDEDVIRDLTSSAVSKGKLNGCEQGKLRKGSDNAKKLVKAQRDKTCTTINEQR
jgi:hypothetical protein